jgi:hypothetical protein
VLFDIGAALAAIDSGGATLAASGDLAADGAFVGATEGGVTSAGIVFSGSTAAAAGASASSPTWSGIVAGIVDSVANHIWGNSGIAKFNPSAPKPQPMAELQTDMSGHSTTFYSVDRNGVLSTTRIETRNDVMRGSAAGADGPFSTHNVVGVRPPYGGDPRSYGPPGAYIDTGDSRGRNIHGGGNNSRLIPDPFAPRQGWLATEGCTRGQNEDVISLGGVITAFQHLNRGVAVPYVRF